MNEILHRPYSHLFAILLMCIILLKKQKRKTNPVNFLPNTREQKTIIDTLIKNKLVELKDGFCFLTTPE
jgi:hypothetical protein